jgi:hypothetical protein
VPKERLEALDGVFVSHGDEVHVCKP